MTRADWNLLAAPATTPARPAVAVCPKSHQWPVRAYLRKTRQQGLFGGFAETAKIVDLETCPECGERWDELLDADSKRAIEFFKEG